MMSFRDNRLAELALPAATVWLLTDIAEAKGRHLLYSRQSPHVLAALRQMAIIQSAESSNRIEGVTVDPRRLRPLVLGGARPRNRSEAEVLGYRRALNLVHTRHHELRIAPPLVCRLHRIIQADAGDAGQFKGVDNEIVELRTGQAPVVRFRPVSAEKTPAATDELCLTFRHVLRQGQAHPLVAVAGLILDFLCIHPFRDGNGRVSRLLTLLALYQQGYEVGRYTSLERLVEDNKEDYYESLARSSRRWHEGRHDVLPWLNYFLAILRRAYGEFQERAGQVRAPRGAKTQIILAAIEGFAGSFRLTDLERLCPGVSRDMIRHVLRDLRKRGDVTCQGRGPAAVWARKGITS